MILQPAPSVFSPFDIGNWRWSESLLWITAFAALIFGILLLVDAINNRKVHHAIWAVAMIGEWIVLHALIVDGSYLKLLEPDIAGVLDPFFLILSSFVPPLIAAGVLYASFEDKKIPNIFMIFVLCMIPVIVVAKLDPTNGQYAGMDWFETASVMLLHIPTGLVLIIVPIMKTNDRNALLIVIGGVLMSVVGIILAILPFLQDYLANIPPVYIVQELVSPFWLTFAEEYGFIDIVLSIVPFIIMGAVFCFTLGMLLTREWAFNVPGIEFEERAAPAA